MQGLVKWFSPDKGYGFVTCEQGQDHYFNVRDVHGAALPSNGDSVSFSSQPGNKGPRALNIKILEKALVQNNRPQDDRVNCPRCSKKIIPRIIIYRGEPQKSVCPYCAATVKDFRSNILGYIVLVIIILIVLSTVF